MQQQFAHRLYLVRHLVLRQPIAEPLSFVGDIRSEEVSQSLLISAAQHTPHPMHHFNHHMGAQPVAELYSVLNSNWPLAELRSPSAQRTCRSNRNAS
jgi:hypothetical protein